jgi:hypothetical protein
MSGIPFEPRFTHLFSLFHISSSAQADAPGFCAWIST